MKVLPFVLVPTLLTGILLSTAIFLIDARLIFSVKTDGFITRDDFIFLTALGSDHWLTCVVKCSGVCPVEAFCLVWCPWCEVAASRSTLLLSRSSLSHSSAILSPSVDVFAPGLEGPTTPLHQVLYHRSHKTIQNSFL